jgi:hypothetical protein
MRYLLQRFDLILLCLAFGDEDAKMSWRDEAECQICAVSRKDWQGNVQPTQTDPQKSPESKQRGIRL